MNLSRFIFSVALVAVVGAGAYHWKTLRTLSHLRVEHARVLAATAEQRRLHEETSRQVAAAQSELRRVVADRTARPGSAPSSVFHAPPKSASPTHQTKSAVVPPNPELRRWQVQAFLSEQRLRFGELLQRLHFTAENRQEFDRIQSAYQHAVLEESQTDAGRQQARQTRDAQLEELFGPNHAQWVEANRNQPARAIVAQIVQQTFQSTGALTTAQAEELTRIVAQHRISSSKQTGDGQQYDWDHILSEGHALLAEHQQESFVTAIEFRRASERMSAVAAKGRR